MITTGAIAALLLILVIFAYPVGIRLVRKAYTIPAGARNIPLTMRDALGPGGIPVNIISEDDESVPGWYLRGAKPSAVVLLHGLGGTRAQLSGIARHLNDQGWGVLLIDQGGHGEHSRTFTTYGRAESLDALAAVNWLRDRDEIDARRVAILGASMGAATAIYAASRDSELACIVADSSYADFETQAAHDITTNRASITVPEQWQPSFIRMFQTLSVPAIGNWATWEDPVDVIGEIKCPVFLIHGELDERIDSEHLDMLSRAARDAGLDFQKWKVDDGGHCKYHDSPEYLNRVNAFLRENLDG